MKPIRCVATLLATALLAHADILPPAQDTSSAKGKLTPLAGKATTLTISVKNKAYVLFDLDNLPIDVTSANILSARLRVYFPMVIKAGPVELHTVTPSGQLWNETSNEAEPAVDSAIIQTFPVEEVVGKKFAEVDVTAIVQAWRAGVPQNYGFAFVASGVTQVAIGSKEGSGNGYPAELDIEVGGVVADGSLSLPATTSDSVGVIMQNGQSLLHTFGTDNFFAGAGAGNFTLSGQQNTATGYQALDSITTASNNAAFGSSALASDTTGDGNSAFGFQSLGNNSTGDDNTAVGALALQQNTTGFHNTACGSQALQQNTTGSFNTASGRSALLQNTTGGYNTASGVGALFSNLTGSSNTATGEDALTHNIGGNSNTASGDGALESNTSGSSNTASGFSALATNATGNFNIGIGYYAGDSLTTGDNNIDIGNLGVSGESAVIRIGGYPVSQTAAFIAGIRGVTTGVNNAIPVVIDSNGQLGTISSSRRYKEDIADMGDASARLDALRPVTFHYKQPYADGEKPVQFGLIAEEVAEVFPELAVRNAAGQPETVKYQDLTPLLLNEFLKERRHAREVETNLREENAELKKEDEELKKQGEAMQAESAALKQRLERIEARFGEGTGR